MYVEDPVSVLRTLRSLALPGAVLSLLEKNRDGIALRPGLQGDYVEAGRLLTERQSVGRLGVENRAFAISEWLAMLDEAGWKRDDWVGIRLFSDHAPDDLSADAYAALVALERAAGATDPYRQVSRLVHFFARASSVRGR